MDSHLGSAGSPVDAWSHLTTALVGLVLVLVFLGRAWALGIRRSVKHPVYQLQITSDVNYWYTNYNVPTLFSLLTNYWPTIYWLYLFIYQEAIPKNNTHHDRKKHFSIGSCWAMSYITTLNNAIETERLRKGYWQGRNGSPIKWGHRITRRQHLDHETGQPFSEGAVWKIGVAKPRQVLPVRT